MDIVSIERDHNLYFKFLPNEIILKILSYTNTLDIFNFCKAYPQYRYIAQDRKISGTINLSRKSGRFRTNCNLPSILEEFSTEYITVFNITHVYWVPATKIRQCLKKLKNLEELYLLGTKVGTSKIDIESYCSEKLKKLSVTIREKHAVKNGAGYVPNLTSVCVQILINDETFPNHLEFFVRNLKFLEELWIHDATGYALTLWMLVSSGHCLDILAFDTTCDTFKVVCDDLTRVFYNMKCGQQVYFEKITGVPIDPMANDQSLVWHTRNGIISGIPYGFRDAKKLMHQKVSINEIYFKELNFKHVSNCTSEHKYAIKFVLTSKNASKLERLAVANCLFHGQAVQKSEDNRKRKLGDDDELSIEEANIIVANLSSLRELEINECTGCIGYKIYIILPHFKRLTRLSLEIPRYLKGDFLKVVLESCTVLESLSIMVASSNESFNQCLSRYIHLAKNLKNFKYQHYRISLETLFYGLASIEEPKMESIFLKSQIVDNFGMSNLRKFMDKNPTLEFMTIVIHTATNVMLQTLSNAMKQKPAPFKIFLAMKDEVGTCCAERIPEFYKSELISHCSKVSSLNFAEDFHC